jgi:hypothetical protein
MPLLNARCRAARAAARTGTSSRGWPAPALLACAAVIPALTSCASKGTSPAGTASTAAAIGQRISLPDEAIQAASVDGTVAAGPQFGAPPPGAHWTGVLVDVCATGEKAVRVEPAQFQLQQAGNVRVAPTIDLATAGKPGLEATTVEAGSCARGWVFFAPTATPTAVLYPGAGLRWVAPH